LNAFSIYPALTIITLLSGRLIIAQERETDPVFGKVTTARVTALKTAPNAQGGAAAILPIDTELRWVMGQRASKYVRVMIPKGPSGWVLESDVRKIADADLTSIALEASAAPCVTPLTLSACMTEKPTGCSPAGSAHGLANKLKRAVPPSGTAANLTFKSFSQLQSSAQAIVDQGVEIEPEQRKQIKEIQLAEGTVGEGSLVRLIAFLSKGTPHANSGESVNCNLKGEGNNDFHISVTEIPGGSEFEGVVVEMIPQDRPASWTLKNLQKLRGKLLMIEGSLFYDNLHFANGDVAHPLSGQPKRFSLWEIHPVTSVKVCRKPAGQCDPSRAADWKAL